MKVIELQNTSLSKLRKMASDLDVKNANRLKKEDLIIRIQQAEAERDGIELRGGILEIMSEGIGFLRFQAVCPRSFRCVRFPVSDSALPA